MQQFHETRNLLENSDFIYMIAVDMTGKYAYVNANYAGQFAHISASLVGKSYDITMHADDMRTCEEASAKCFEAPGSLIPATIRKHNGKGGFIYTQWEFRAMFMESGLPAGVFCLGYDISDLVAERIASRKIIDEMEEKSSLLNDIVFQQTHTVRAPLTNLMALTRILHKNAHNREASGNLSRMILETAQKLDDIIMDIVRSVRRKNR